MAITNQDRVGKAMELLRAGLKNFFSIYRQRVDSWQMYDHSGLGHRLIASGRAGGTVIVEDQRSWADLLEGSR